MKIEQKVKASEFDLANVEYILSGGGTWFTAKLMRLVSSADHDSKRQIYLGFPDVVDAVHKHQTNRTFTEELKQGEKR